MPQESLRSVVYRSLVTCTDPNGVVEYETMRKTKTGYRKEQKIEKVGNSKDSIRSSVHKENENFSEDFKEELHNPPPFQILEVSRGAQKLNLMIDSWSKRLSFDGQSKDIARDLLEGALDLQESLVMLCRLQETSTYLGQTKKKDKQKYEEGIGVERNNSDQFGERHNHSEIQRGRPSLDGSSKSNSVEELKKVIRDSLTRQNLLSIPSDAEKDFSFSQRSRNLDDFSDIPSTSSSQSSMVHSTNSTSADWSVSSTSKEIKAKVPSVIAKLMGLEDFPSERSSSPLEGNKTLNRQNIEIPNARGAFLMSQHEDPERKTLKEIIDSMHLKGVLRSHDVEGLKLHRGNCCDSQSEEDDEVPPIVVIKPLCFPCKENEDVLLRTSSQEVEPFHNFSELVSREQSSKRRSSQCEGEQESEEKQYKWKAKVEPPARTFLHNGEALKIKQVRNKVKAKETPIRKCIQEHGLSNSKEIKKKQEVKEPVTRENASANKVKPASVPLIYKPREKGANSKKIDKVKKVLPSGKIAAEKDNMKPVTMSRSTSQVKTTSTKPRKPDSGPIVTKSHTQRQESTTQIFTLSRSTQSAHNSIGQAKHNATRKIKTVKDSTPNSSVTNKSQSKHKDKEIDQTNTIEFASIMTSSDSGDRLLRTQEAEPSKIEIAEPVEEQKSYLGEVPAKNNQCASTIKPAEELKQFVDHEFRVEQTTTNEINLKTLLSSNSSFLSCAEDLFELHIKQPIVLQTTFSEDANMIDTRLFLDCANELMECKSRRTSLVHHPLFCVQTLIPSTSISSDKLLEEICHSFEKLKNYAKVIDDKPPIDSIHKMLENDIKCKETLANGAWDLGWENGYSVNEADQVLGELEKQILGELIEEIIVDYPNTRIQHLHSW